MTHLTPGELVDALEGVLAPERQAHVDACAVCRREAASLSSTLGQARQAGVPEPSPLFWEYFSSRVRDAVAADATAPAAWGWRPSLSWRIVVPIAGLAMVVAALIVAMPRPETQPTRRSSSGASAERAEQASKALPLAGNDEGWRLVAELVGPIDWETASEAGLGLRPGAAEVAVLDLTAEEQLELRRLLDAELKRPKS
jgi:hypothetical protein